MYVMETIFDHNMTEEEHDRVIGGMSKERFFKCLDKCHDEDSSNYFLAKLFYIRKNEKKMMEYLNRLPLYMKTDFLRMISPLD